MLDLLEKSQVKHHAVTNHTPGLSFQTELEIIALVDANNENNFVLKLFEESVFTMKMKSTYSDIQAYVQIARDTGYSGRTKHTD